MAVLQSQTIENGNKNRIILNYDAIGAGAVPKASKFKASGGRIVKGNFPAPANFHAQAVGYGVEISETTGNQGAGVAVQHFLNMAIHTRLRQSGRLYSIEFYVDTLPAELTAVYFSIWDGPGAASATSFTRLHEIDILPQLTAGQLNTVVFTTPLAVSVGNFTSFGYAATSAPGTNIFKSIPSAEPGYLADGMHVLTTAPTDVQTWGATHSDDYIPLKGYMEFAPSVAIWGDSLIAGFPQFYGFVDPTTAVTPLAWKKTISAYIEAKLGVSVQNLGWSGQLSVQIKDRVVADVPAIKPTFVICEGGINDANGIPATTANIKVNFAAMFDAAIASGCIPVVAKVWAATARSNAQMAQMDEISGWFDAMKASTYPTLLIADFRDAIGQFRPGGPVGNRWDLKTSMLSDSVHLSVLGNETGAEGYIDAILQAVDVIKSGNSLFIDVNYEYGASDNITISKTGADIVPAISPAVVVTNNITPAPERLLLRNKDIIGTLYEGNGVYPTGGGPAFGKFSKKLPAGVDGWVASTFEGITGFILPATFDEFAATFNVNNPTGNFDAVASYVGQYIIDYNHASRAGFGTSPTVQAKWFCRTRRTGGNFFIDISTVMSNNPSDWTQIGALNPALYSYNGDMDIFFAYAAVQPYGFNLVDVDPPEVIVDYSLPADVPAIVIPKSNISFTDAGVTIDNIRVIYKIGNPIRSYKPERGINSITSFEIGNGYYLVPKAIIDLSPFTAPPTE